MSKAVKKKARRLRRTIRRTLGTLFLISALVVAAIPVDNLQASGEDVLADARSRDDYLVKPESSGIPEVKDDDKIYTTEDKKLQFAYVREGTTTGTDRPWAVVLVGFGSGYVKGETLTIPDTVDAYRQYTETQGQDHGYVAVGKEGNFLFYRKTADITIVEGENDSSKPVAGTNLHVDVINSGTNEAGKKFTTYRYETGPYIPCYLDSKTDWAGLTWDRIYYFVNRNNTATDDTEIPKSNTDDSLYGPVDGLLQYQRIENAAVNYISNQYKGDDGSWKKIDENSKGKGVFAGTSNIATLSLGKEFKGIGDYAFFGSGITSIEFRGEAGGADGGNGLSIIGEGAFEDCIQLKSITLNQNCPVKALGRFAFKNCRSLTEFSLPWSVTQIGDSAFEGCDALRTIDLCSVGTDGTGSGVNRLKELGYDLFKGCSALQSVTFPDTCTGFAANAAADKQFVYISMFEGCTSLRYVCARNSEMTFAEEGDAFTYEQFKNMLGEGTTVNGDFYFEGPEGSKLHDMCKENCFAYSYIGGRGENFAPKDRYELTMLDPEDLNKTATNTFVVTSGRNLISYTSNGNVTSLTIPTKIGPHYVEKLDPGVFRNCCKLETVLISTTVDTIGEGAFAGCHNLTNVIFTGFNLESGDNVTIGANAFRTQDFTGSTHECKESVADTDGVPEKKLHFTGPISSTFGPFQYAMSSGGTYNNGSQKDSYITYYSGWPSNLEIEYDPKTGLSKLVKFPALSELATEYESSTYKYLHLPGAEENSDQKTAYEVAMENVATNYPNNMTPNEQELANAVINLVIPEGVQSVEEGLIREKGEKDPTINKTVTAYSLLEIKSGEPDTTNPGSIKEGTGTFAGCKNLTGIHLLQGTTGTPAKIDDYAFQDCTALKDVTISADYTTMGRIPFYGCENLSFVNFDNHPKFTCDEKSFIYELDANGNPYSLIECLEGKSAKDVTTLDLGEGITEIKEEAFRGSKVRTIDLSATNIDTIPKGAFAETENLTTVTFPESLEMIEDFAFVGSEVDTFFVRCKNLMCAPNAFYGDNSTGEAEKHFGKTRMENDPGDVMWYYAEGGNGAYRVGNAQGFVTEETEFPSSYNVYFTYRDEEGNQQEVYAENRVTGMNEVVYPEIPQSIVVNGLPQRFTEWKLEVEKDTWHFTAQYGYITHTVTFWDSKDGMKEVYRMEIADTGNALVLAADIEELSAIMNDSRFVEWDCEGDLTKVTGDYTAVAKYRQEGQYIVQYLARKGSIRGEWQVFQTMTVMGGESAPNITGPTGGEWAIEGYTFNGWLDLPTNINSDEVVYASYTPGSGGDDDPNNPDNPNNPSPSPSPGPNPSPSPSPGPNGNGGNTGSSNTGSSNTVKYKLTVQGGSGSGSYAPGEQIIITANPPARGQEFSSWTVSPANTVVTDKTMSSVIITMPKNDVAAIANYKARTTTSTGTGNGSNTNSNRPSSGTGTANKGNTVVIDKNGLSNTGVVSATVNGSSDNFTIKVSESSTATEAVLRALLAEYGSVDNIKYFPMDISLYDSTGTKLITDTTGLSVSITLPLPDSLITYAGNNKVAGVVNDKLDKLTPRFTTINGVACVTFTAEHFSPYVIYVDITNLSDGTISDSTPTTGDGIHPKWFLSIGLACLSFVMFMVKDNGKSPKKKQKVAVRA